MKKYIILDFDGTIADTFKLTEEIADKILERYSVVIDDQEAKRIGLRRTIIKSKFPKWQIPKFLADLREKLNLRINEVKLFPEMHEVLKCLAKNYNLGILASNTEDNIKKVLQNNEILDLFSFIYSGSSLFGKHRVLKKLYKKYRIFNEDVIYVGDEDRDIQAAKKARTKVIAVTWGYNFEELLIAERPDYLVRETKQLLEILKQ